MAWPDDPWWVPLRAELAFGAETETLPATWTWTDASQDVEPPQSISITRGRPDEAGRTQPASASLTLTDNSGDYTPGQAQGAHWPLVREGVPARLSAQVGGRYMRAEDAAGARARTASSTALDVTEDLDVRVDVALDRLPAQASPTADDPYEHFPQELIARYNVTGSPGQRMWRLLLSAWGRPLLAWSTDGDDFHEIGGTAALPYVSGQRFALRAVLDVDDGAGGHEVRFWIADTLSGPWRPLGQPVVGSGTTMINQVGDASLEIADINTIFFPRGSGRWYGAELRDGLDGSLLASPDFTSRQPGDTEWTDAQGNLWQLRDGCEITDWRPRLQGAVSSWAPSWPWGDLSAGTYRGEARTDITIAGPLRRLSQGQQALQSTLRRRVPSATPAPLAYWPLEEDRSATQAYSPIEGVAPLQVSDLSFGSDDTLGGSAPLPTLGQAAVIRGTVPGAQPGGWHVELVFRLDELPASTSTMIRLNIADSDIAIARVRCSTSGVLVEALAEDYTVLADVLSTDADALAGFTGEWNRLALFSYQDGADTVISAAWRDVGEADYFYAFTTVFGAQAGRVTGVQAYYDADVQGASIGHVGVWDVGGTGETSPGVTVYDGADDGYTGERALARMRRLAEEERVYVSVVGDPAGSPRMGPQGVATWLDLVQECVDADGGVLSERRDVVGLQYRPRYLMYNQQPRLVLSARGNEITLPFAPVLDDQRLRNDVTVTRSGGSSARAVDDESVATRGRYDTTVTLNVADDALLDGAAAWRLHLGTWPGMRYPQAGTDLTIAPQTLAAWLDVCEGDRIQVTDLPPQHPAGAVDLIVQGIDETLTQHGWDIVVNASPGGPWVVGEVAPEDPGAVVEGAVHVDTDGSELRQDAAAGDTSLWVMARQGPEWVTTDGPAPTDAGDLPVDLEIAGEVVTATAIEPLLWDTYGRTVTDGWGTGPGLEAPTWQLAGGADSERSVDGTAGLVTPADDAGPRFQFVNYGISDSELLCTVTIPAVATGASLRASLVMRISGSDYYEIRTDLDTGGGVGLEVAHTGSSLTGVVPTRWTYSAGTTLWLRSRIEGQRVRGRVWDGDQVEPRGLWQVDHEVTTSTIALGAVGVSVERAPGNTNSSPEFAFGRFEMVTPQRFTVTRAVNGIAKDLPFEADVRLAQPMIVAL